MDKLNKKANEKMLEDNYKNEMHKKLVNSMKKFEDGHITYNTKPTAEQKMKQNLYIREQAVKPIIDLTSSLNQVIQKHINGGNEQ